MVRTLGGIVAGMAGAISIIMVTEAIGNQIAPASTEAPISAILGSLLGAVVGGFLAIKISDQSWTAWAIAAAVLVATIVNFLLMAYPLWVMAAGLVLPLVGAWLAQRICAMAEETES